MMTTTPVLSTFSVLGAVVFFVYLIYFDVRVVGREVEELDKGIITPADFTLLVEGLPGILEKEVLNKAKNQAQVMPEPDGDD